MLQFACWLQPLQGCLLDQVCSQPSLTEIQSVRFVRYWDASEPAAFWVGEATELIALFQDCRDLTGLTFFSAGAADGLTVLAKERGVNLAVTSLELLDLHERLSAAVRRCQRWSVLLLLCQSLQDVVNKAAELANGALFLLNTNFQVVCSGGRTRQQGAIAQELIQGGALSPNSTRQLTEASPGPIRYPLEEGIDCWFSMAAQPGIPAAWLVLFAPDAWKEWEIQILLDLVQDKIHRGTFRERGNRWAGVDFRSLLHDLLAGKLISEDEIDRRFSMLPQIPQAFCSFIIVESASPASLLSQLEAMFPESNLAVFDSAVVLMLSQPNRNFQPFPIFDKTRLEKLLNHYDAYAAISNATSKRGMLRTNYLLTRSTLQLGRTLRRSNRERIFFFEDYAEYIAIDLCINSFSTLMGHDDIIYLTHPEAVKIYRYDLLHQTNLSDVLYYYCLNDCNVSKAAKAAYMHRNTFSVWRDKLLELIKADLSDGETRQRMIFSYKILRYYDRYARINLSQRLGLSAMLEEEGMEL